MKDQIYRELRLLLPSGEAVLFLPREMKPVDFEVLDKVISLHRKASMARIIDYSKVYGGALGGGHIHLQIGGGE